MSQTRVRGVARWAVILPVVVGLVACATPPRQQPRDAQPQPDAVAGYCGDRALQDGEGCDDGNLLDGDGCSPQCQVEPGWVCSGAPSVCTSLCGNGVLDPGEQCEGTDLAGNDCTTLGAGYTTGTLACLASCRFDTTGCRLASCGNGVTDPGEECDDGNASNEDACMNNCQAARCGDGYVRAGVEECDDGNTSNSDACLLGCVTATCGDGYLRTGVEACDDGNLVAGDGCSPACTVEAIPTLHWATGQPAVWGSLPLPWAGQPHAPSTPIVAAANVDQQGRAYVFTATSFHVLSLPGHQWIDSGSLNTRFPGVPGAAVRAAWGVSWASDTTSTIGLLTQEGGAGEFAYLFGVENANLTGPFVADAANPMALDFSADPLAPDPAQIKAAFLALANPHGWTSYDPSTLCAAGGSAIGPYLGVVTNNNALFLQDSGFCWLFYAQMPLGQFPPFTQAGAPQPSAVVAMFYTTAHGQRLYAIATP